MSDIDNTEVEIKEKVILININKLFTETLSQDDLYEVTRGIWRLKLERAEKAHYAFATYQGVIQEVFRIDKWCEAGTTEYGWRIFSKEEKENRYEFLGKIAEDGIRTRYTGKSIRNYLPRGSQNPIRYVNI